MEIYDFLSFWMKPLYVNLFANSSFFRCSFGATLNLKMKKTMLVFFFYKYGKFWSILLEQKVERKPLFSEEWWPVLDIVS